MENQEENTEPPGPRTRRACRAIEAAKKVEERRILEELPHVMLVRLNEEVRQQAMDKVHDQGRRPNDAILRGESAGGNLTIKKEVVEEEEEEGVDEGRQEIDALQQGDEVEVGDEDVSIKEEVSEGEEMLEANPVDNHLLAEGQAVAISMDLLQELEVKVEDQDEGGQLVISEGGVGEGEGTEQEPILLDDEGEDVEANRREGGADGGQKGRMQFHALKNSMQGEEVNVDEDVAAEEGVDESNTGQSFVDDAEDQAAKVEFFSCDIWDTFWIFHQNFNNSIQF